MPREIRCIFQGGGAKLPTLLAAAEALEELEADKKLRVLEVAGCSAGSIAAFFFAHKTNCRLLRHKMANAAAKALKHLATQPTKFTILRKILFDDALYNDDVLRQFFRDSFCEQPNQRITLKDTRIPVFIRTADIRQCEKITRSQQSGDFVEDILSDSCSIPFIFRTSRNRSALADGGIVSNLVTPEIFSATNGVLAFSFERANPNLIDSQLGYYAAVISAAIDNSVAEARSIINEQGGVVCDLPADFGTFEFERALDEGFSDEYQNKKRALIKEKIRLALLEMEIAKRKSNLIEKNKRLNLFATKVINRMSKTFGHYVASSAIICIANGLERNLGGDLPKEDVLIKQVVIMAGGDSLLTFKVGISKNQAFELSKDVLFEITTTNGNKLEAHHEIIESKNELGEKLWHSCFCLHEPLAKIETPIRVKLITRHIGLMDGLNSEGKMEWMRAASHQSDQVNFQDFVLFFPTSLGKLIMNDLQDHMHRVGIGGEAKSSDARWHRGRAMGDIDLEGYRAEYGLLANGWSAIGWRATNVPGGSSSGVVIEVDTRAT